MVDRSSITPPAAGAAAAAASTLPEPAPGQAGVPADLRQPEARRYRAAARRRGRLGTAVSTTMLVAFAVLAGHVDAALPGGPASRAAALVLLLGALLEVVSLPFAIAAHRAARAVGLSRQDARSWAADRGKGLVLGAVLVPSLAAALVTLQRLQPERWSLLAFVGATLLSLALTVVAPVVLLPLFVRSHPLGPGPLRTMADDLVARSGLVVRDVRLLELSTRTTGANAAVVGMGPTRRILLGDTLLGDDGDDERLAETRAVLAHELGHHAHADLWRLTVVAALTGIVAWTVSARLLAWLPAALAHGGAPSPAALPAFALAFGLVSWPLGLVDARYSRRRERAADAYACRLAAAGAMARALERLVVTNLAELEPPVLERIRSGHPSPAERIATTRAAATAD
jgi:STE24 endopeptidase